MQDSVPVLTKKAIEASLKGKWQEAVSLNLSILDKNPKDIDAKVRLGRAYIQLKDFSKAKKMFKEVLQADPINQVALKNLKLATEGKVEPNGHTPVDPKSLIKEPGTTVEINLTLDAKRITSESFSPTENLDIKVTKKCAEFSKKDSHGNFQPIGKYEGDLINKLYSVKEKGGTLSANFVWGKDKDIRIIIRSSLPVFRDMRQEVKPYIKPGTFDEPEMEIPTEYDE